MGIKINNAKLTSLIIYSTSPEKKVIGEVNIENILRGKPDDIWNLVKGSAFVTEHEFYSYLGDHKTCSAIVVSSPSRFIKAISLSEITKEIPSFSPPQRYQFIKPDSDLDKFILSRK